MGWTAGTKEKTDAGAKGVASKRGILLILGGLVVTGAAAAWAWLRRMPKDE
jgi:hypothetical protein